MKKQLANFFHLKLLFLIIFFTVSIVKNSNSQFLKDKAVWTVKLTFSGDEIAERYEKISALKDTVINDTVYKLFHYRNSISILREKNKKVYYKILKHSHPYRPIDSTEQVLYDFNLNLGDSIFLNLVGNSDYYSTYWHVIKVDSIKVNEELKKRMLLHMYPSELDGFQYWIEDIGSTYGPLFFQGISDHEWTTELVCYQLNGKPIYGRKCSVSSTKKTMQNNVSDIIYNSFLRQVKVKSSSLGSCILNTYTIKGEKINSQYAHYNQNVSVQHLKPGMYIFEMVTKSERKQRKIIIK